MTARPSTARCAPRSDWLPTSRPAWAETLRFIERMTDAAERRDIEGVRPDPGPAFLPLKRRIRPVRPAHAVRLWLARLDALTVPEPLEKASPMSRTFRHTNAAHSRTHRT